MRHRKKRKKLGRTPEQRKIMLKNLATSLFLYEKITTTAARAKALKSYSERLITAAKVDNLAHRRTALRNLTHKNAVKKLFEVIGPKYKNRAGGYTRTRKSKARAGDCSELSVISLVE